MRTDPLSQPVARPTSVEPSRAWILGLVVESDGTLAAPQPADAEWPAPARDLQDPRATRTDQIQDGTSVRP
jgi:hypothetical protein